MKKKISCNKCFILNYYDSNNECLTIKCTGCGWIIWKKKKSDWKCDIIGKILINSNKYSKGELKSMTKDELDFIYKTEINNENT